MTVTVKAVRQNFDLESVRTAGRLASIRHRLVEILARSRLGEKEDCRWRVNVDIQPVPNPDIDRGWELAVVVADRVARGLFHPAAEQVWALGVLGDGEGEHGNVVLGALEAVADASARLRTLDTLGTDNCQALLAGDPSASDPLIEALAASCRDVMVINHLGNLAGYDDAPTTLRTALAYFPAISGIALNDRLVWVQLAVCRVPSGEEGQIQVLGVANDNVVHEARSVLNDSRAAETRPVTGWKTVVRFQSTMQGGGAQISGNSYQLAMVLADRIARGREVPPPGRLIATGASTRWILGQVESVLGGREKCKLISELIQEGDRILVPKAWEREWASDYSLLSRDVERAGASCAAISTLW